jgi:hypothetical protein
MSQSATVGGGPESQALEIRPVSPRVEASDAIVYVGALALILLGWWLKSWHDNRLSEATIDGVTVAYPTGWLHLPVAEPVRFQVLADDGTGATLTLYAAATSASQPSDALFFGSPNPAEAQSVYTQLGNQPATIDGQEAVQSDYAYVRTVVGRSTPPTVMRGRQVAWIADGELVLLALEAPESYWDAVGGSFDRLTAALAI